MSKCFSNVKFQDDTVSFKFNGTPLEANRVRTIFLTKIPTIAVDRVEIHKNSSVHIDELLISRLELIPILVDATKFSDQDFLVFDVAKKDTFVMSTDITGKYPFMEKIVIIQLKKGQEFACRMFARKGTGGMHAKWSAVAGVGYKKIKEDEYLITVRSNGVYKPSHLFEIGSEIYLK